MAKKDKKSEPKAVPAPAKGNSRAGRAVHCDPETPPSAEQKPLPDALTQKEMGQKSPAEWAYQRLILYIQNFEEQLDEDHEVAVGLADGASGPLRIEGIGYFDPDIVTFYGTAADGQKIQLIQHVSQLSVALRAVNRKPEEEKPRRIGFQLARDLQTD